MTSDTTQLDRAGAALLGAAVGDALGAPYEFGRTWLGFEGPRMIGGGVCDWEPGEWTDDTAMTWCIVEVAATGVDLRAEAALDAIAARFRQWYADGSYGIGQQTWRVLNASKWHTTGAAMSAVAADLHARTGHTAGNGSLMRTAPVALAHLEDPAAVAHAAMKISALTHHDPRAQEACALWSLAIRHAIVEGELDARAGFPHLPEEAREYWAARLDEAEEREPASFTPNGWVVTALQAAWSAISHTPIPAPDEEPTHLVDALLTVISVGHDTDTTASIAGALLGARWGLDSIPTDWRQISHGYPGRTGDDLVALAQQTVTAARAGTRGTP